MSKKIVIIGAGYSGTLTAKYLSKDLKDEEYEITLIDKNPFHTMLTELHEVAAGRVEESSIRLNLKKIFAGRNVNVSMDTVTEIDFKTQKVKGSSNSYFYDYLVLSAGSRPNYFGIEGASEHTYSLWSYEAAVRLNERFQQVFLKASKMTDAQERKKLLTFWVVGAGFSGVEMISELSEYVPVLCKKYHVEEQDVTLYNVDGLNRVVPVLSEALSQKAEKKLAHRGIKILLNQKVEKIEEDSITLKACDPQSVKNEGTYPAGTVIWTAGTQSEVITKQASEVLESSRARIQVDEYLRSTKDKKIYVVGDNMFFVPPNEERPVPQMVENCEQSSHIAAHNIISELTGKSKLKEYKPAFHGVMVSIGSHDGVASVGMSGHLFQLSGFLAIAAKHFINIIYFLQVLGFNKVAHYMKDEFFTIRNKRSCVGGHFSNRTASFFLVPLRVWVGLVWLLAGLSGASDILGKTSSIAVLIFETILGIFLITGFFTTISSIVSLIMFVVLTPCVSANVWMIFANIALMNKAGMILGLDYYVMPALNKLWQKIPFIHKKYLYVD